jgi:hypothetical protein
MRSPGTLIKSQGSLSSLRGSSRKFGLDNPFLGLSSQVSPRLWPACPGVVSAAVSPKASTAKLILSELRSDRKPKFKLGNFKLKPSQAIRVPSAMAQLESIKSAPLSPRTGKTPSFSEVRARPGVIKKSIVPSKHPYFAMRRVTSLKALREDETNVSSGSIAWKRAQLL